MKKITQLLVLMYFFIDVYAQGIGIGTNTPHASSILDLSSNSKGLLIPRMTTTQRNLITSPALGLMVYDSTIKNQMFYNGDGWVSMGNSAQLWTANGSDIHYVPGKVGIGLFNPGFPLHVKADGQGITQESADGVVKAGIFTNIGSGAFFQTVSNHPLNFSTGNGAAHMTVSTSGNIGMGTQFPSSKLHVVGNSRFNGDMIINNGSQGDGKVLLSDASGKVRWQTPPLMKKCGFHVRGIAVNGANVLAPNTFNKIHFANEVTDYDGNYTTLSGTPASTFTAPVNGFYHFDAFFQTRDFVIEDVSNYFNYVMYRLMLRRNGNDIPIIYKVEYPYKNLESDDTFPVSISTDVRLLAGDIIWVDFFHNNRYNYNLILDYFDDNASFSGHIIFED